MLMVDFQKLRKFKNSLIKISFTWKSIEDEKRNQERLKDAFTSISPSCVNLFPIFLILTGKLIMYEDHYFTAISDCSITCSMHWESISSYKGWKPDRQIWWLIGTWNVRNIPLKDGLHLSQDKHNGTTSTERNPEFNHRTCPTYRTPASQSIVSNKISGEQRVR